MKGYINLIRTDENRIIPALNLGGNVNQKVFSQIRSASEIEIIRHIESNEKKKKKARKGRKKSKVVSVLDQDKVNKYELYIGKLEGLKNESVVMLSKLYIVEPTNVLRKISEIPDELLTECMEIISKRRKDIELHKEMHVLKKKILNAQLNNEKYTEMELRLSNITNALGYETKKKVDTKGYESYRVVPNKGHIKVYLGGR